MYLLGFTERPRLVRGEIEESELSFVPLRIGVTKVAWHEMLAVLASDSLHQVVVLPALTTEGKRQKAPTSITGDVLLLDKRDVPVSLDFGCGKDI